MVKAGPEIPPTHPTYPSGITGIRYGRREKGGEIVASPTVSTVPVNQIYFNINNIYYTPVLPSALASLTFWTHQNSDILLPYATESWVLYVQLATILKMQASVSTRLQKCSSI